MVIRAPDGANNTQVQEQELCSEVSCDVKQRKNAFGQHEFPYLANNLFFNLKTSKSYYFLFSHYQKCAVYEVTLLNYRL